MNEKFQVKVNIYDLRESNCLCQPKFNEIIYGNKRVAILELTSGTHYLTI